MSYSAVARASVSVLSNRLSLVFSPQSQSCPLVLPLCAFVTVRSGVDVKLRCDVKFRCRLRVQRLRVVRVQRLCLRVQRLRLLLRFRQGVILRFCLKVQAMCCLKVLSKLSELVRFTVR
jgi:hypothetical protein